MWLFLLLVAVPIVEIALFIEIGGWIGLWPTLGVVVATAFAGTVLLRRQGFAALAELGSRIEKRRDPTGALAHGALILVAGVLLLTPGFFTDAVGFALLVPAVRAVVLRYLATRITVVAFRSRRNGPPPPQDARRQTVETRYEDVTDGPEHGPENRRP